MSIVERPRHTLDRWWRSNRFTVWGVVLSGVSLSVAGWAVFAGADKPINVLQTVLFVVIAGLFQAGAGLLFNRTGRADPSLARSAVRRLIRMGVRAQRARILAEKHYETGTPAAAKKAMGTLSAELSYLEEGFVMSSLDWAEFHPEAFRAIQQEEE